MTLSQGQWNHSTPTNTGQWDYVFSLCTCVWLDNTIDQEEEEKEQHWALNTHTTVQVQVEYCIIHARVGSFDCIVTKVAHIRTIGGGPVMEKKSGEEKEAQEEDAPVVTAASKEPK